MPIRRGEVGKIAAVALGVFGVVGLAALVLAIATRPPSPPPPADVALPAPVQTPPDAGNDAGTDAAPNAAPVTYALDDFPRRPELVTEGCPDIPLVDHAGVPVPWEPPLRVHPSFVPAVTALEQAIEETAREVYGRDVGVMRSASSYRCTTVRHRPERISEHALGNAIDLRGIVLADGTETSVADHWHARSPEDAIHAHFWRALVERVHARGIFRGILGPPAPDHADHLHFDRGPSTFFDLELDASE